MEMNRGLGMIRGVEMLSASWILWEPVKLLIVMVFI
jgi:hypothetical protein